MCFNWTPAEARRASAGVATFLLSRVPEALHELRESLDRLEILRFQLGRGQLDREPRLHEIDEVDDRERVDDAPLEEGAFERELVGVPSVEDMIDDVSFQFFCRFSPHDELPRLKSSGSDSALPDAERTLLASGLSDGDTLHRSGRCTRYVGRNGPL